LSVLARGPGTAMWPLSGHNTRDGDAVIDDTQVCDNASYRIKRVI